MALDILSEHGFSATDFNIDPRWIEVARDPKLVALASIGTMLWSHSRARRTLGAVNRGLFRRLFSSTPKSLDTPVISIRQETPGGPLSVIKAEPTIEH